MEWVVITFSMDKNYQNFYFSTWQHVWIQTIPIGWASCFTGMCKTGSNSKLQRGCVVLDWRSSYLTAIVRIVSNATLWSFLPLRAEQLSEWKRATEEEQWWRSAGMNLGSQAYSQEIGFSKYYLWKLGIWKFILFKLIVLQLEDLKKNPCRRTCTMMFVATLE